MNFSKNFYSKNYMIDPISKEKVPVFDLFKTRRKNKKKIKQIKNEKKKRIQKSHRSRKKSKKQMAIRYDNEVSILQNKYCFDNFVSLKALWNEIEEEQKQKQKEHGEWVYFNVVSEKKEEDKKKIEEKKRKDEENRRLWYEYLLQHTGILR